MKLSARGLMAWVVVLSAVGCECGVPPVDPMSLVIEPTEASVLVGDEVPLRVRRVNGEDVTDLVTWISADGALASVEGGRVRGVSVGQVRVLAQLDLYEAGADVAINARPVSCSDGALNGDETDLDCGGALCAPCAVGLACVAATDCQSSACRDGRCQRPSCTDGVRNGGEAAVDCGGECPGCAPGTACTTNADCSSQLCVNGTCSTPTCSDGARNGTETDVDCGGTCDACPAGGVCTVDSDCATGVCASGTCAADSCSDGVRNGLETDVDCGGLSCAACPTGGACLADGDCASSLCESGTCAAPSCMDQRRNGDETGPDCGG
ncbi:MAG TPA: Ig-like domain-containing protein, partial [Archangium sp.]